MRYLEAENPHIIGRFTTGDSVTVTIYDLSDNSVIVNPVAMSEILTTGYFKYQFNPSPILLTEYLYIMTNGIEEHAGKIMLGGFPDQIKTETDKIQPNIIAVPNNYKADVLPLALEATSGTIQTLLEHATFGLSALKDLIDTIDTSTELQARFTEIKGVGWTSETLKSIQDAIVLAGIKDWTTAEAQQIRDALGIDGTKVISVGGKLQDIKTETDKIQPEIIDKKNEYKANILNLMEIAKRTLGLSKENIRLFNPVYNADKKLLTAQFKIYETKLDCETDANAIGVYSVVATYNANGELTEFMEVKD